MAKIEENQQFKLKILQSFSHELRTPLNGAIPPLEYYFSTLVDVHSETFKIIKSSLTSLQRLHYVLNNLIDYASLMMGELSLNLKLFNLRSFLTEIIGMVNYFAAQNQLTFIADFVLSEIPEYFQTDQERLKQILLSLISHSIQLTKLGSVTLRIKTYEPLNESSAASFLYFEIKDTSQGFNKLQLNTLTRLLQSKLDEEVSSQMFGLDLHILISQYLALQLGPVNNNAFFPCGLTIKSKPTKGTTISFYIEQKFQQRRKSPSSAKKNSYLAQIRLNNNILNDEDKDKSSVNLLPDDQELELFENATKQQFTIAYSAYPKFFNSQLSNQELACTCSKILIVDDDQFNLFSLKMILSQFKLTCDTASNGQEAMNCVIDRYVKKIKTCKIEGHFPSYKCIFMDYQMPVMDGVKAAEKLTKLKKLSVIPDIPIFACTAFDDERDKQICFDAGMAEYITKPISYGKIQVVLKKYNIKG